MSRRPIPTELKKLRGNPGRRRLNKREPVFEGGTSPPKWLDRDARTEWKRLAGKLKTNGMLTPADRAAFMSYCISYSLAKRAHGVLEESETLHIVTGTGGIKVRPEVDILLRSLDSCRKFLVEFGMTPSARARIDLGDVKKNRDVSKILFEGDDDEDQVAEPKSVAGGNVADFKKRKR